MILKRKATNGTIYLTVCFVFSADARRAIAIMSMVLGTNGSYADEAKTEVVRLYNQTCVVCHDEGVHGAPRPGARSDWEEPLSYGVQEMYLNTIEGIGEMPPRGMCNTCTDDQLKALVDYMIREMEDG